MHFILKISFSHTIIKEFSGLSPPSSRLGFTPLCFAQEQKQTNKQKVCYFLLQRNLLFHYFALEQYVCSYLKGFIVYTKWHIKVFFWTKTRSFLNNRNSITSQLLVKNMRLRAVWCPFSISELVNSGARIVAPSLLS